MDLPPNLDQDPLVAALPPATDYITYLTLLEYQLTAENLPVLNRLLSDDDGTLAQEIGWDLLKLVLPILAENPEEAQRCLEIIARRGNPREVVVRIAEELEKVGEVVDDFQDDGNHGQETQDDESELPTFPGEATRIHLGNMTLDGMPATSAVATKDHEQVNDRGDGLSIGESEANDALRLKGLFSMLGILHPRIKTQYPSRFLATSLPASLGAYRRIPITNETTSWFLDLLTRLMGKKRPELPPRTSSISVPKRENYENGSQPYASAPLPDPEASTEENNNNHIASSNEREIIARLLRAVMLEVLDEFMSSLQARDLPFMSLTARLRETFEPKRSIPGKIMEVETWKNQAELIATDDLVKRFHALGLELGLNIKEEIGTLLRSIDKEGSYHSIESVESSQDNNESEYPTSPSQIPYPPGGIITLFASESYYQSIGSHSDMTLSLADFATIFISLRKPNGVLSQNSSQSSFALEDAALSLIYTSIIGHPTPQNQTEDISDYFQPLLHHLSEYLSTTAHPQLRDDAHHIATKLLHSNPNVNDRIKAIKATLVLSQSNPAIAGHLKAVAVNWLKEEILIRYSSPLSQSQSDTQEIKVVGINPDIFSKDAELLDSIFPDIPSPPASDTSPSLDQDEISSTIIQIPFWTASINLAYCLVSQSQSRSKTESDSETKSIPQAAKTMLEKSEEWCRWLISFFQSEAIDIEVEVYALEDACQRLRKVLGD